MADERQRFSFVDCESDSSAPCTITSAEELQRRPWKFYWPPISKELIELWVRSEHSSVLSWHFNPEDPFDRPWRGWARSETRKKEPKIFEDSNEVSYNVDDHSNKYSSFIDQESHDDPSLQEPNLTTVAKTMSTISPTSTLCLFLDLNTILNMQLARIYPSSFNYLAPLQIYSSEKPYHSRIPFPDNVKRTNIEVQSYDITIFDIRGKENLFTLEQSGFRYLHLPTNISHWTDQIVLSEYLPFISNWLKIYFDSRRVLVYTYNVCR